MSAEILRKAASAIREDYSAESMGMPTPDPFMFAVADWIDAHAGDLGRAGDHVPSCDSPGDVEQALSVARAYLGDPS